MSAVIDEAVKQLSAKVQEFDGIAKFVVNGEGSIMIDRAGVREGDEEADVVMTADADVFRAILDGAMDPTSAFLSGKLAVEGSMAMAMQLAAALS